jgi:hypothetical protein
MIKAKTKKTIYIFNKNLCGPWKRWHNFYRTLV